MLFTNNSMDTTRPNPDALLEASQREEEEQRRGKLKIFFGASAGVGKTYAMLAAAREALTQGVNVVVGVVETHGRKETARLLQGLEVLPQREMTREGNLLKEFDLDAALIRAPTLLLVDELAHSNIPGSRHPKRWQDIEELLQSGIHVYTTLNVQHLESLNDVVGNITGVRVWETVPDRVFDRADEVVLVDLPPDELIRRLNEGKVYHLPQAEQALKNFFNKGNLVALRELSLRRTADRVDADLKTFRASRSIQQVWPARESLLVGVGRNPENAIRAAARLAERMEMPWYAVHIETVQYEAETRSDSKNIQAALKMAEEMGAQTATIPGRNVSESLVEYARSRNIGKILVARDFEEEGRLSWKYVLPPILRPSVSARIARLAPDLDVIRVAVTSNRDKKPGVAKPILKKKAGPNLVHYSLAALSCLSVTAISGLLHPFFEPTNIAMLFLLAVLLCALRLGRGPAVFCAFLSVATFDYFFVPPHFTFAVSDFQYILTFGVMLVVALITGYLTAGLRYQARAAARRESRFRALYEMARDLSGALLRDQVVNTAERFLRPGFQIRSRMLFPDAHRKITSSFESSTSTVPVDFGVAQWAFDHGKSAGLGTDTLPGSQALYIPLKAPMRMRGVLVIEPEVGNTHLEPEQIRQIEAAASLLAIALERVHYVEVAQDALVRMESERLRNSLLSALSHDVRTPLTAIVGLADTLAHSPETLSAGQQELVLALRDEAERMNRLVHNLLDMAQLAAGKVRLHPEWQSLEESVGGALRASGSVLTKHSVVTDLPRDLPLIRFDAVLIERVLCNLLENAAKYSPPASLIRISARVQEQKLEVVVEDNGPGFPPGKEEGIFEKFTRGEEESAVSGIGLGLSICRAVIEAHGGKIRAERPTNGGTRFIFSLPLELPPEITPEITEKSA